MRRWLIALFCVLGLAKPLRADTLHDDWQTLLSRHVKMLRNGHASALDYRGVRADRALLSRYLDTLSAVSLQDYSQWPAARQLAFLINAYNAWTVELVLRHYGDIDSIKDIGGWLRSPWRQRFIPLLGETRSLDDIEHRMIRRAFSEPRIHFAVNCASIGCPALAAEAYRAETLEQQLQRATHRFLGDPQRNLLRDGRLYLSKIFDWYRKDFEQGWRGQSSLEDFLASYADALALSGDALSALRAGQLPIRFLDYDWRLNDIKMEKHNNG